MAGQAYCGRMAAPSIVARAMYALHPRTPSHLPWPPYRVPVCACPADAARDSCRALEKKPKHKAAQEKALGDVPTACLTTPFVEAASYSNRPVCTALAQAWVAYLAASRAGGMEEQVGGSGGMRGAVAQGVRHGGRAGVLHRGVCLVHWVRSCFGCSACLVDPPGTVPRPLHPPLALTEHPFISTCGDCLACRRLWSWRCGCWRCWERRAWRRAATKRHPSCPARASWGWAPAAASGRMRRQGAKGPGAEQGAVLAGAAAKPPAFLPALGCPLGCQAPDSRTAAVPATPSPAISRPACCTCCAWA